MKERELLIRSVVNLMLTVLTRSLTMWVYLGYQTGAIWIARFVCVGAL
jgi:hypothetical protein